MSPESIFRIASMTKPITSTAAMILADQGRLDLSDPISKYLPEFKFMKVAVPRKKGPATTSPGESGRGLRAGPGLPADHGPRPADAHLGPLLPVHRPAHRRPALCRGGDLRRPDPERRSRWPRTSAGSPPCPCTTSPGTAWEYGLNTDVLGRLVEVVSGQSLDAFFAERIFRPLKMDDTYFVLPEAEARPAGRPLRARPGRQDQAGRRWTDGQGRLDLLGECGRTGSGQGYFSGGAGLLSTAGDYARFLQMLLNRGELDGVRMLRPETVDAMTRDQTEGLPLWIPRARVRLRLRLRRDHPAGRRRQEGSRRAPSVGAGSITPTSGSTPRTR